MVLHNLVASITSSFAEILYVLWELLGPHVHGQVMEVIRRG
jgi:hypothetical protein